MVAHKQLPTLTMVRTDVKAKKIGDRAMAAGRPFQGAGLAGALAKAGRREACAASSVFD